MEWWLQGIGSEATEDLRLATLDDFLLARDQPGPAAAELGGLAALGNILWRPENDSPPDIRVCLY